MYCIVTPNPTCSDDTTLNLISPAIPAYNNMVLKYKARDQTTLDPPGKMGDIGSEESRGVFQELNQWHSESVELLMCWIRADTELNYERSPLRTQLWCWGRRVSSEVKVRWDEKGRRTIMFRSGVGECSHQIQPLSLLNLTLGGDGKRPERWVGRRQEDKIIPLS